MAKPKIVRSRLRRSRSIRVSTRPIRTKPVNIRRRPEGFPPELHALVTRDIEDQLKELVARFGEEKVLEVLGPLITKCKWNDWQCVANAIRRIARQK
jgi:hypothetical protein